MANDLFIPEANPALLIHNFPHYAGLVLAGYLIGSIPFGLILAHLAGHGDIRRIGSGNIGATNVLRTGNKGLAVLTMILDALKGTIAVILAGFWAPAAFGHVFLYITGFSALIGHLFPVWLKFKGGKGVATAAGLLTALEWPVGLATIGIWVGVLVITRYSSLAALTAAVCLPATAFFITRNLSFTLFVSVVAAVVIAKHGANIRRLLNGTESKIGSKK